MQFLFPVLLMLMGLCWILIPWMKARSAGLLSIITSALILLSSLIPSVMLLAGTDLPDNLLFYFPGTRLVPDAMSAWFILIINVVFVAGSIYGLGYLKQYSEQQNDVRLHWFLMPVFHFSMIAVCSVTNWFFFLVLWEIMSLSSFILILFERKKENTLKAALNYFIQMHISILFLMTAVYFLWSRTGSLDFIALSKFSETQGAADTLWLFLLFFFGFALKSGFVPFHTWLPHAHPAAPAHLSGIMSGVIIKMGIYGILRVIMNLNSSLVTIGWILLLFSIVTALYGIMQATVQQNLKRFLAYSSIENIGIIGLGIGIGTLGLGYSQPLLIIFGFGGALLHVFNHGMVKSILFFCSGNLYQSTHTMDMERLGGLAKRMPHTAFLFIFASVAVCAIPPLNGFISEFLVYAGLFQGILTGSFPEKLMFLIIIMLLTVIGGMAILAFTKSAGITLLGNPRENLNAPITESTLTKRVPLFFLAAVIISVGFFPMLYLWLLKEPLNLIFANHLLEPVPELSYQAGKMLMKISILGGVFTSVMILLMFLRRRALTRYGEGTSETWGCGYTAPTSKMQYTGASFTRIFRKLFHPIVFVRHKKLQITELFPKPQEEYETQTSDRIEDQLIREPVEKLLTIVGKFRIFQNGQIQYYLLYGFIFILLILLIEVIP